MRIEFDMPKGLEEQLKTLVLTATKEALEQAQKQQIQKQWMSLKEGCEYAGVSYNTFMKYRELGLKVCEIDGVKRISKQAIDEFFIKNSF